MMNYNFSTSGLSLNSTTVPKIVKTTHLPRDGYDVPVYGVENGDFVYLHITAIACIAISFTFSLFVIAFSARLSNQSFFERTKSERFLLYMALCDGLFNLGHSMDHIHIFVTKEFPRPRALCVFYAFTIGEFISAQMLMVNVVAINAFSMIYLRKDISFGKYDWRLLVYTFGIPFVIYLVAAILGKLGPTGAFCHFDAVKGTDLYVYYLTILTCIVIFVNSTLYVATWIKIYRESKALANVLGDDAQAIKSIHTSARNMSLFVAVFFIQWAPLVAYSVYALVDQVPEVLLYLCIVLNNIGGVLNGIVFVIIKRRKLKPPAKSDVYASNISVTSRI